MSPSSSLFPNRFGWSLLISDLTGGDFGPVDAAYAAIYCNPLIPRAPWQLHLGQPTAVQP